jgi:small subunit ribosomal protein S17
MAEAAQDSRTRGRRRLTGIVTSANKTPKTLRVVVQYRVKHRKYSKYMRHRTVLHVHDEKSEARTGDRVEIMECRPVSKTKTWRLVKVIERAPQEMEPAAASA